MRLEFLNPSGAYEKSFVGRLSCMPKRVQGIAIEPGSSGPYQNLLAIVCSVSSVLGVRVFS